jgi:riboflavin synthase
MFTGLIQDVGVLEAVTAAGANLSLTITSDKLAAQIAVGDSVAVSGACLTASAVNGTAHSFGVTAVAETLRKTRLALLRRGSRVNLELSLRPTDRLGGHLVQGHVDATGVCTEIRQADGSWILSFSYPEQFAELMIEKGSIAVDGVSLTAYDCSRDRFRVSVVPHTWESTTLGQLQPGELVNLEFDMIGKYVLNFRQPHGRTGLTVERLADLGY